jgi:diguanylate cyclase (GGDEF)-like protein
MGVGKPDLDRRSGQPSRRAIDAARSDSDADQAEADADQTGSDRDQTAADRDQTAADQDEAHAANDQRAADGDQTRADQRHLGDLGASGVEAYEALRPTREENRASRLATHVARARTAQLRAGTAAQRDASGAARDETAQRRNLRGEAVERPVAASDSPLAKKLERVRVRAAAARARATAARSRAAASEDRAAQGQASTARERARLESELLSANLDDLTGAFRREMGKLVLNHEIDRARRGDGRFVIVFADVDGLKRVNDRDGHAAGDHVLETVVLTIRSNLRSFDPIVRYGGDEFVCGLGGVDHDVVARRFEVIDRSVQSDVGVGISVGLAGLEPDDTLDLLTARADAALLDVKKRRGSQRGE